MIKQCERCHADFDARRRAKYCPTCQPIVRREQLRQAVTRWQANHPEYFRNYYHEVVKPRKVKEQKIKHLREHLANISAKCKPEPEPERHWADELAWTSPLYF